MIAAAVLAASVWAPGLPGWNAAHLLAETPPEAPPTPLPPPAMLGATERRRTGPVIRLALAVAAEAAARAGLAPASLRCVFASSNGDGVVVGSILDAMARAAPGERVVSPTQFHNSVHNAAAGYWSIAHGSRAPVTCLGAHDQTWAAGLMKAVCEAAAERVPVLLVCYDHPLPPPLDALRHTGAPFAAALVLAPLQPGAPTLQLSWHTEPAQPSALPHGWDAMRRANPAAASLPLLRALAAADLAAATPATLPLPYLDGHLALELRPKVAQ